MERILFKVLLQENEAAYELLHEFMITAKSLQKIYCNIFTDAEIPSASQQHICRLESRKSLSSYTYPRAKALLKSKLAGSGPFFLDLYAWAGESISVIRIEAMLLVYIVVDYSHFAHEQHALLKMIDRFFVNGAGLAAYCCAANDGWHHPSSETASDYWRHLMYQRYNTLDYHVDSALRTLTCDEIWLPSCWGVWLGSSLLHRREYDRLCSYQGYHCLKPIGSGGLFLQLYQNILDYPQPTNRLRYQAFYVFLGQFWPPAW